MSDHTQDELKSLVDDCQTIFRDISDIYLEVDALNKRLTVLAREIYPDIELEDE